MHETSGLVFAELLMNFLRSKLNHGWLIARVVTSFKIIFCCYGFHAVKMILRMSLAVLKMPFLGLVIIESFTNFLRSKLNHGYLIVRVMVSFKIIFCCYVKK